MKRRCLWLHLGGAALLLACTHVLAGAPGALDAEGAVAYVNDRQVAAYHEALQRFDLALEAAPADAGLAVQRCRFISDIADLEDTPIASAGDDLEACLTMLRQSHPDAPEAQLFAQQRLWGKEAIDAGEALLKATAVWPAALRAQFLAHLSEVYADEDQDARAGELAVDAVRLGDASQLPEAIGHLAEHKQFAEAARLLAAAAPAETSWSASRRVRAALALPDPRIALGELRRYERKGFELQDGLAARVYLRAGDHATAARLVKDCDCRQQEARSTRFDVAIAAGDYAGAVAVIDWTQTDRVQENLRRFVQVLSHSPMSVFRPTMLVGAFAAGALVLLLALLPGLLLLPVHYRGLARRVAGRTTTRPLFARIGLAHAWAGLALVLTVPMVVGALVEPSVALETTANAVRASGPMFRSLLWGSVAALGCMLLVAQPMGRRHLLGDAATVRSAGWVLLCWAGLFTIGALLAWLHHDGGGEPTMQTQAVEALARGGVAKSGLAVTLLLFAVVVPALEELTFRGLLLGGLSRHISFGWANTLQAALFMVVHNDWPRFPFYLAMGLFAGWLVRRTRSLAPAIALHALNNALAIYLTTR